MTLLIAFWIWSMPQAPAPPPAAPPALLERLGCAPMGLPAPAPAAMRVIRGDSDGRAMSGPGDAVIVGGGTAQGVQKGQQYFIRRPVTDLSTRQPKVGGLYGVHTAGWVTVVDVKEAIAVATVTHACDGILEGDYLEPFVPPVLPDLSGAAAGAPDYEHPGHILMADELRQAGYPGLVMLVDRGSDDGVRAGHLLTIFRATFNGQGPVIDVGRGTVISASLKSSLVRIDSSREAVYLGDMVAIHRITP